MRIPPLESVFLNPPILPGGTQIHRVLMLSGGKTTSKLALRLQQEGFEVVVLGSDDDANSVEGFPHFRKGVLEEVRGFIGRFEARLSSSTGLSTEPFGFIVASPEAVSIPKFNDYGLMPSDRVIALSGLESLLDDGVALVNQRGKLFHVAFFCGLEGECDPTAFARVFDAIARLRSMLVIQPYVFTRDVKVAAPGLERRYRHTREEGVLFFKFDADRPVFENGPDGVSIIFQDPVLGLEMELLPDLIVVDEDLHPPTSLRPLLSAIPSSAVMAPFLQPQSTRFSGVTTPKAGILATGPSRGNFDPHMADSDIEAVVVTLKTSNMQDGDSQLPGPPVIDPGKCTICLTCIRLCPHGAMSFHKRAEADPASCKRCGICAAECPMAAITLDPPVVGETCLTERIDHDGMILGGGDKRITAFMCRRSAAQAFESAGLVVRKDLTPVVVPCAGTIAPEHILSAFQNGADGVLVAGCHKGNCASIYGTTLASERVLRVQALLEEAGIVPQKLMFTALAGNTPGDLAKAIQVLKEVLNNSAI